MKAPPSMQPTHAPVACELPILRLGLAGFTPEEEARISFELARQAARRAAWELAPLAEADAWFVNGTRLECLQDGTWRVMAAQASHRTVRIDPSEAACPLAVSKAPQFANFSLPYQFDVHSPDSIQSVLEQLEGWLRPVVVRFAIAAQVIDRGLDLISAAYHVTVEGRLYAVISRQAGIAVWPIANPVNLARALWHRRPAAAGTVPPSFMNIRLQEALWEYATRTKRNILPAAYRRKRLHLRLLPPVPSRLISDDCLLLVRELRRHPGTFRELVRRTGMHSTQMARQLAALFVVGSVTVSEKRLEALADPTWNSSLIPVPAQSDRQGVEMTVQLGLRHQPARAEEHEEVETIAGDLPDQADERIGL